LLTTKCVCNTALGVTVDWMFWICVLGKTTFSSYVGLKTASYTAVSVPIVVYRRIFKLHTQLNLVQRVRISPFMHFWLG